MTDTSICRNTYFFLSNGTYDHDRVSHYGNTIAFPASCVTPMSCSDVSATCTGTDQCSCVFDGGVGSPGGLGRGTWETTGTTITFTEHNEPGPFVTLDYCVSGDVLRVKGSDPDREWATFTADRVP